ncbi:MAG: hypothetical protein IKL48_06195 [Elusimicrobiaceae bacterium]|nr:hypothetical protein [Elusimicrobiaceae bacterium]
MFNLFNKGSKVRAGNQKNQEEKKKAVAAGSSTTHALRQNNLLGEAWKKLQKMDRKQAYTWGAVAVVSLVALISIASVGGPEAEDFNNFETRGYDLANMPFSTDEAEQYLLASKYPDLNDKGHAGLYSKSEKEARQAEDAAQAEQAKLDASASSTASQYRPGRYGGGSAGGAASPTQVGSLSSANLKSASGSGMKSTFGPQGDFSNFRTQEKGSDKFLPKGPGKGDARKALFQTAQASRAAANLKNDKLLNAKKAMMGGNVQGSDAFMEDGKINLDNLKGLELDTNAPMESADLSGLDDAVGDANTEAAEKQHEEEEKEWWEEVVIDVCKKLAEGLINMGMNAAQNAMNDAKMERAGKEAGWQDWQAEHAPEVPVLETGKNWETQKVYGQGGIESFAERTGGNYDASKRQIVYDDGKHLNVSAAGEDGTYTLSKPAENAPEVKVSKKDARIIREEGFKDLDQNKYGGAGMFNAQAAGRRARFGSISQRANSSTTSTLEVKGRKVYGNYSDNGNIFKDAYGNIWKRGEDNEWKKQ